MIVIALCASAFGCHHSIRKVSDCDQAPSEQRIACSACLVENEAGGLLGEHEFDPDADADHRCIKR
jgi:hypothetical protein